MRSLFFLLILFLTASYTNVCAQWIELNEGLYGGPVSSFLFLNDTIYAGTEGGVYRSMDSGNNWNRINVGLDEVFVNGIVECGGKVFVAINGGQRIYELTNNNSVWTSANNGLPSFAISKLVSFSNVLFGMTNQGALYKSTDLATSWIEVNTPSGRISSLASTGSTLVVGTDNGVYISDDLGQTWLEKSNGLTNKKIFSLDGSNGYLICWTEEGVFFSKNTGTFWIATGLSQNYYYLSSQGTTIIARSTYDSYISYNDGTSWSNLNQVPAGIGSIFINETIFAGTQVGIYRSSDAGVTWSATNTGLKNNIVYAFAHTSEFIFIGTQNGVYRSNNNGALWSKSGTGLPVAPVWSLTVQGNTLLAGFANSGIYSSTDGGNTWTKASSAAGVRCFAVYKDKLLAGAREGIYQSVNGGLSWSIFTSSLVLVTDLEVEGNRLRACSLTGVSITDNGTLWTDANAGLPSSSTIPYSLFTFADVLFLGTLNNTVFKSENSQGTWKDASVGIAGNGTRCFSSSDSTMYAGSNAGVFMTTDTAKTWTPINDGLPISLINELQSLHVYKRKLFAGPYAFGVWVWAPCLKPPTPVVSINGDSCQELIFTSSSDTGNEWYLDGIAIREANGKEHIPITLGQYQVKVTLEGCASDISSPIEFAYVPEPLIEMPNVFTPNGDAYNSLFMPEKYEGIEVAVLTIYDRWGQTIYTSEDLQKGWDGGEKPSGVYYYYIKFNGLCNKNGTLNGWVNLVR